MTLSHTPRTLGRLLAMVLLLLLPALAWAAGPKMEASEKVHDFGTIKEEKGHVTTVFEITNTGDETLELYDVTAECGCTRPEFSKKGVAPGKKTKIKVTFNPAGRRGNFEKTITIKSNAKPTKMRLKIRGTIIPKE